PRSRGEGRLRRAREDLRWRAVDRQPRPGRREVVGLVQPRSWFGPLLRMGQAFEDDALSLRGAAQARELEPRRDEADLDQKPRRSDASWLFDASSGGPGKESADGSARPRRSLGARLLGLQPDGAVACNPWLRPAAGELPRLHRLRKEGAQWRQSAVGAQNARRSDRFGGLADSPGRRRSEEGGDLRRLLRGLCSACRGDFHAKEVLLCGGHRGSVQSEDVALLDSALLGIAAPR